MSRSPTLFVSYSWDNEDHRAWVRVLSARLREDGIDVTLDQWHVAPGDQLPQFMERSVRENDFVAIVCTPRYKMRSNDRLSGVGYEGDIMTAEVLAFGKHRKFVPLLREGSSPEDALPSWLLGKLFLDFRGDPYCEASYKLLIDHVWGRGPQPPPLGNPALGHQPSRELEPPTPDFSERRSPSVQDSVTVLIPVYNESRRLRDLFKALKAEGLIDKYEIILCDDGSTDNSFDILQQGSRGIPNICCIRNRFNQRKVGAIAEMAKRVRTPFVLTLDADSMLVETQENGLERLIKKMTAAQDSVTCFRIIPHDTNLLGRLQKIDYTIFTDAIRRVLGVPVCVVGQGMLWKTDSLLEVLAEHSGAFDGDDLENTVIALRKGMRIHWERELAVIVSTPKKTMMGFLKQRALSWEFGMFRVLLASRVLLMSGNSGAFYKNVLLTDFVGHPLRLLAVPMLLSAVLFRFFGPRLFEGWPYTLYAQSVELTFRYGAIGIFALLATSVISSCISVRGRIADTLKWAIFSAIYLSSPFVYVFYFKLLPRGYTEEDLVGASIRWVGSGLLLTYLWWMALTLVLLWLSSLTARAKAELTWSAVFMPAYYFLLLFVCRTAGILKFLTSLVTGR